VVRKRTRSREIALQMLYMVDVRGSEALDEFDAFLDREAMTEPDIQDFARQLVVGTQENLTDIDAALTRAAQNWQLRRMAIVDRNILRMAVYEMLHLEEVPAKVSINEAIELGKRFSTAQSGSFINGILDRIRREKKL
jgi:transcription antitermination factor NusB